MDKLQEVLNRRNCSLHLVLGYGDSHDGTGEILFEECSGRFNCSFVETSHGGLHYGSVIHPKRFKQLAFVWNKMWENIPSDAHVVGMVESDLIWQPYNISSLALTVGANQIYAPMVYHEDGRFYDTLAFAKSGIHFQNNRPFHPDLGKERHVLMDSVGSVMFMHSSLARQVGFTEDRVVMGMCDQARQLGAKIWLDTGLCVYHR